MPNKAKRFFSHCWEPVLPSYLCASSNKQPILLPHLYKIRISCYFCYQPLLTNSQFCCHTTSIAASFAHYFQQGASFAITLLILRTSSQFCYHTSIKQPVCYYTSSNKQPVSLSHLYMLRMSCYFCYHTAISAATALHPSNKQPILLPHFCIFPTNSQFCCHITCNK